MPAKQTTPEQHAMLHKHWPNDCCLCAKEQEIEGLKLEIKVLQTEIDKLRAEITHIYTGVRKNE